MRIASGQIRTFRAIMDWYAWGVGGVRFWRLYISVLDVFFAWIVPGESPIDQQKTKKRGRIDPGNPYRTFELTQE